MIARIVGGIVAAAVLLTVGVVWLRSGASARDPLPAPRAALASGSAAAGDLEAPVASDKTREEKRFGRYDHDKDGWVTRDEYLASRHKAFARLDTNGDRTLSFDEWAAKAEGKFAAADADKSGILNPAEFTATRVVRTAPVRRAADCPPQREPAATDGDD